MTALTTCVGSQWFRFAEVIVSFTLCPRTIALLSVYLCVLRVSTTQASTLMAPMALQPECYLLHRPYAHLTFIMHCDNVFKIHNPPTVMLEAQSSLDTYSCFSMPSSCEVSLPPFSKSLHQPSLCTQTREILESRLNYSFNIKFN